MRVLCIDNDPEDIEFFIEGMTAVDSASTCKSVLSGQEGLNHLSSISNILELPDYIFLDINMSPMDGMATLQEIRKTDKYKSIKIVMLSTALNPKYAEQYLQLGADSFMEKATSFEMLFKQLKTFFKI